MALTTTTGLCSSRSRTIPTARSMALASPTEVPPNFMTMDISYWNPHLSQERRKMAPPLSRRVRARSPQISLRLQQLGVEQRGSGGTADRIVGEQGELPVKHSTRTQAADRRGHATAGINIKARLRTISRVCLQHGSFRRAGEFLLLWNATESHPCFDYFSFFFLGLGFHRDGFRMPILDSDAIALCAHFEWGLNHAGAVEASEQLARLLFHLFFFFGNVGDHVPQNIQRSNSGISGAADCLH